MKKIAIISTSMRGGGAERVILNISKYLNRNKFDITLILLDKEGEYKNLLPKDIKIIDLKTNRVRKSFFKLIYEINKVKPDVIFSTMAHLNILVLLMRPFLKKNSKIIVREANTPSKENTHGFLKKNLKKTIFNTSDIIVMQCDEMKEDFHDYYKIRKEKLFRIYNPIDIEYIVKNSEKSNPFNKSKINILGVGRLTSQKGFDNLITAVSKLKVTIPNIHLTIIGQGPLESELKNLKYKLNLQNHVTFAGFIKNPFPYYKFSDLFVLSSNYEGFPNSLLEAITVSTNVLSTSCKSGPKEILNNGNIGTLVEVNDVHSLVEGILKAINKNEKLELFNRSKDFDVKNIIKEYEKIFLE